MDKAETIESIIKIFLFLILMVLVVIFLSQQADKYADSEAKKCLEKRELRQLVLDKSLEGSFFLATGSIGEEPYYFMYAKTENGGFQLRQENINRVEIFEQEGTPYITECNYEIRAFVPKGSIINTVNINLDSL